MEEIKENWNEPVGDIIDVPDCLMPLFNKVGMQMRFVTISGKNEVVAVADIVEIARQFFKNNPDLLK